MKNAKYVLRLALTLFLITAVVAGLLGLTDAITRDKIAAGNAKRLEKAMADVLPADSYVQAALPAQADSTVKNVHSAVIDGQNAGFVVEVRPVGFGGELALMVGVDAQGRVAGVAVVSHSETSGLGAIAAADSAAGESFRSQFIGSSGVVTVTKDGGSLDALTGATVTSRAVCTGVNAALACAALLG